MHPRSMQRMKISGQLSMLVLCRDVEASTDLSSAAEQVCCLVEALLLHYNHSRATATGKHHTLV